MNDIIETIARWIVHAAIFRAVWSAPGLMAAGAAVAALAFWWFVRSRARRR